MQQIPIYTAFVRWRKKWFQDWSLQIQIVDAYLGFVQVMENQESRGL